MIAPALPKILRDADPQPDLSSYDRVVIGLSGGKDSIAALLAVMANGVPAHKIELWHHDVDGGGGAFMDWPVTPAYCRALADALGLPLWVSYRDGGFQGEMDRDQTPTARVVFETPEGDRQVGGRGPLGTRGLYPQVSADLSVRWCSAYLKIDVMAAALRGQERFNHSRTLVVTGERAEESPARARYSTFEKHRADARDGRLGRHVDHWRPVHAWNETEVWGVMRAAGIVPHVAYQLGWGRLSCLSCIFGSPDQWATIRAYFPARFALHQYRENRSGRTIQRAASITQLADRGTPYAAAGNPDLISLAESHVWSQPILVHPDAWALPAGAFGESAGPT